MKTEMTVTQIKTCREYVGVTCVNGSCPIALSEDYFEYGIEVPESCLHCWHNHGCEDCALKDTEYCDGLEDKSEN